MIELVLDFAALPRRAVGKPCGHGAEHDYRRCSACQRLLPAGEGDHCWKCGQLATRLCRPCQR